jgi:hypothetical protein
MENVPSLVKGAGQHCILHFYRFAFASLHDYFPIALKAKICTVFNCHIKHFLHNPFFSSPVSGEKAAEQG